jgi:catechol 2,3-dioxygenase-like lactoylglutathione lyase family enzyme
VAGIARMQTVVVDCPDPEALARFYAAVLGWEVVRIDEDGEWATISDPDGGATPLSFQRVADYRPPRWPDAEHPQQFHIDLRVDDVDKAEAEVLALGATRHEHQPAGLYGGFRVYLDPAGHPFCLCFGDDD